MQYAVQYQRYQIFAQSCFNNNWWKLFSYHRVGLVHRELDPGRPAKCLWGYSGGYPTANELARQVDHPRIKLVELECWPNARTCGRSLGVMTANEYVCTWNSLSSTYFSCSNLQFAAVIMEISSASTCFGQTLSDFINSIENICPSVVYVHLLIIRPLHEKCARCYN